MAGERRVVPVKRPESAFDSPAVFAIIRPQIEISMKWAQFRPTFLFLFKGIDVTL